jgi:hypothetical protein
MHQSVNHSHFCRVEMGRNRSGEPVRDLGVALRGGAAAVAMERTFDYEQLRKLIRDHPEWSHRQLAAAMTEYERKARRDPGHPAVSVHAVASTKYRYRDQWTEQGDNIQSSKKDPARRSQPFNHLPRDHYHGYEIQALRTQSKIDRGEPVTGKRRREAENLFRKLRSTGSVIDVTCQGEPYIRPARPDEIDGEGNLIEYAARFPGLDELQWKALRTPEARAAASSRWRALVRAGLEIGEVPVQQASSCCPDGWAMADAVSRSTS